jgi:hypothetical protein
MFLFFCRSQTRGYEETIFTRSEGAFQRTVLTDFNSPSFREFSTESESYRARIRLDSFKLKNAKFKNNNSRTRDELDKIEVCPNNLINLVRKKTLLLFLPKL